MHSNLVVWQALKMSGQNFFSDNSNAYGLTLLCSWPDLEDGELGFNVVRSYKLFSHVA